MLALIWTREQQRKCYLSKSSAKGDICKWCYIPTLALVTGITWDVINGCSQSTCLPNLNNKFLISLFLIRTFSIRTTDNTIHIRCDHVTRNVSYIKCDQINVI